MVKCAKTDGAEFVGRWSRFGLVGVCSSSVSRGAGTGPSALAQDEMPKGALSLSPLSFGFQSSERRPRGAGSFGDLPLCSEAFK